MSVWNVFAKGFCDKRTTNINDDKKCENPSSTRNPSSRWWKCWEQPHSRLFVLRLKTFHKWPAHYINSKSCSLVRTICVSDYFCHSFSPHFSDKKGAQPISSFKFMSQANVGFLFLLCMKIVKITRENEKLDSPQFAESIPRDLIWRDGFRIAQLYHTSFLPTTLFLQH